MVLFVYKHPRCLPAYVRIDSFTSGLFLWLMWENMPSEKLQIFVKRIPEDPSVAKAIKKIRNMLPNTSIEVVTEKEGIVWDLGESDENEPISVPPSEASDVEDEAKLLSQLSN